MRSLTFFLGFVILFSMFWLKDSTKQGEVPPPLVQNFEFDRFVPNAVAFNSDESQLNIGAGAFESNEGVLSSWDFTQSRMLRLSGFSSVTSLATNKESNTVVSLHSYKGFRTPDLLLHQSKKQKLLFTSAFHQKVYGIHALALSSDGKLIATGAHYGQIAIIDAKTGYQIRAFKGHSYAITSLAFVDNNKKLLSIGAFGDLNIWDTETYKKTYGFHVTDALHSLAVSPSENYLAIGGGVFDSDWVEGQIVIFDLRRFVIDRTISTGKLPVTSLAYIDEGTLVSSCAGESNSIANGMIDVWDLDGGRKRLSFSAHEGRVTSLSFSSKRNLLASAGEDCHVKIWNMNAVVE